MKKFDPIDIFFIAIISAYFITLGCFIIALILTYVCKTFKTKNTLKATHSEKPITFAKKELLFSSYLTNFNTLLTFKPIWPNSESIKVPKVKPKGKLISLPIVPKIKFNYNAKFKNMIQKPNLDLLSKKQESKLPTKIKGIFAKKNNQEKRTFNFNDIITKLFKTKKKTATSTSKKEFNLANNPLFRRLFMKEVKKEVVKPKKVEELEIKKEQLNIFDTILNEIETNEAKELEKTKKLEPIKDTKLNKEKPKTSNKPNNQKSNNKKKASNNKKTNPNSTSSKNNNSQNKKKTSPNKRANGTTPKKKQNNNKKNNNYKKKKNNNQPKKTSKNNTSKK